MKKVLVAIDIARSSGNDTCIKTAQDIAGTMDGTLILLHVIEPIPKYIVPSMPVGVLAKRKLEEEEETRKLAEQYNCSDVVVREGGPATVILEYASEINADLIVLNSHDPGLAQYFLGSVAGRVVRRAHCSVHVVRNPDI
ncbi:MAG: universal stress protein [Alphaproteobacteria bacterium]|nr:universal stress protein [Alphaproteobacteria bacterium]